MLVVCIGPVVHQILQQIKVVRHRSQAAIVNVFVRSFAATWTDSPHDRYILGFDHFFEQASIKQILVIGEILACLMIRSKESLLSASIRYIHDDTYLQNQTSCTIETADSHLPTMNCHLLSSITNPLSKPASLRSSSRLAGQLL